MSNAYKRLVDDLKSGELKLTHIDIAVMEWINWRTDILEHIKDLLAKPEGGGLIRMQFKVMKKTIGCMELACRRGMMHPEKK